MKSQDFDTFYRSHQEYVRIRICALLYRRPDLIDDAIQVTRIKLWRGLPKVAHQENLKGWVKTVVKHAVIDITRSQKIYESHISSLEGFIERTGIEEEEFELAVFQEPDPHSYIPERLERQEIRAAVWEKTNAQDRAAFVKYINNESVVEREIYRARWNFKDKAQRIEMARKAAKQQEIHV